MRKLSRTGIELGRGAAAEFVILDLANSEERPLSQPAKVGRVVNDSRRDQLAMQRLLGRK